jgi:S1-C subfamily serine protease
MGAAMTDAASRKPPRLTATGPGLAVWPVPRLYALVFSALLGLALPTAAWAAEPGGWFGISLNVDAGGFALSPTVNSATVLEVARDSPAASGGVRPGDELLEVGGLTVAGGKAQALQAALAKSVGETLTLRLKRPNGETVTAVLTAVRKPVRRGST